MLAAVLLLAQTSSDPAPDPRAIAELAWRTYRSDPAARMEELYKWIFHAVNGGDHAVRDDTTPRRWMEREWATLTNPFPHEREIQRLDPDGRMIRVNLRPYRARGGDPEFLLATFVASAQQVRPRPAQFRLAWQHVGRLAEQHPTTNLNRRTWNALDLAMRDRGYPMIHHSPSFEEARKPAYRVIAGPLWLAP